MGVVTGNRSLPHIRTRKGTCWRQVYFSPLWSCSRWVKKGSGASSRAALASHEIQGNRVTWTYEGVNNSAKLSVAWRFDEHGPWMEPVIYQTTAAEDVVSLHYFAEADGDHVKPSLEVNNLVLPGISESPAISPLANPGLGWNLTSWLGRGVTQGTEPGAAVGIARPLLLWLSRPRRSGQRGVLRQRSFRSFLLRARGPSQRGFLH